MAQKRSSSFKVDLAYRALLPLCCGTAVLLAPALAFAQSNQASQPNSAGTLEEVVVTARKRSESLQDVPVAVVAISQADLQKNIATDLNKLSELSPQVVIGRTVGGTGSVLTIRGISSSASDPGLDQSVAVSVDNVPLSRGRIIGAALFDLQQVEVMQGPQALFFGKNSPAGVISITSADPTNTFEGYVTGGYEFKARERFVEAVVSGPLTDTLKGRLAVRYDAMDGWIKNVAVAGPNPFQPTAPFPGVLNGKRQPGQKDIAGRLTLLWTPTEDFEAKFKLVIDKQDVNSNGAFSEGFCINGITTPTQNGLPMPGADCQKNMQKAENSLPAQLAANYPYGNNGVPYGRSDFGIASLNLTKTFDNFTLASTTGWYDQQNAASHNADFSPFIQIYSSERERYQLFTQEVRLNTDFEGPVNLMVGGYFETADRHWLNAPDLFHVFNRLANNYTTNIQTSDSRNTSYSAFAQLRWKLLPNLELAGGARYSKDNKKSTFLNLVNNPDSATGRGLYPAGVPLHARYKDDHVSPEATLTWKPDPDQTLYLAWKTGYKSGGISNAALLQATATPTSVLFGAEKVKGFEGGYKAELLGRTLRLDVVGYRYNYDGLQVTSFDSALFRYRVTNAANARTEGVTASFKWLATEKLSFDGSLGYNRGRYLNFPNAQCYVGQTAAQGCLPTGTTTAQNLSGKALNRAPKLTYNIGADYVAELPEGWTARLSTSASYTSSYQGQTDYGPGGHQKSFWRVNAAVRVSPADERFELALIGRNLTNSYYLTNSVTWPGLGANHVLGIFNRPREVVLQGTFRY